MNLAATGRRLSFWLADTARLIWGGLYWNARKSAYVARRRSGRCPCQCPSDDPVPGRVRCNAVLLMHQPARFRAICPLLAKTDHGWCCTVSPGEVRPFWGRTVLAWAGGFVAVYLSLALAVFLFLRPVVGLPVTLWQVAWPGAWSELRDVRADALFRRAVYAFERGNVREALLALESTRQIYPNHHAATRLLAQITMLQGSWDFADRLFWQLIEGDPARRIEVAVAYHDVLVGVDRADALADLCLGMVQVDPGQTAKWVRSLLFALRRSHDADGVLASRQSLVEELPAHARLLVEAERAVAEGNTAEAIRQLSVPFPGPYNATYMEEQVERLADLGGAKDAQVLLAFYGPMLGSFEQTLAQFALDAAAGDAWAAHAEFDRLLGQPLTPEKMFRIAERLIKHPDAVCFRQLNEVARKLRVDDRRRVAPVFWATAWANNCGPEARAWRSEAERKGWGRWPEIAAIDFTAHTAQKENSPLVLIQTVELPREIVFALVARMERSARPNQSR